MSNFLKKIWIELSSLELQIYGLESLESTQVGDRTGEPNFSFNIYGSNSPVLSFRNFGLESLESKSCGLQVLIVNIYGLESPLLI